MEALQGAELSRTNDRRLTRVVRGIVYFFYFSNYSLTSTNLLL